MPRDAFRRAGYGDSLDDLIGRNTYYTDGAKSVDLGLYKGFRMPFGDQLLLRLDVFNVFNKTTFAFPNNDFASAGFGTIVATAYTPRTLQLGLRYIY